MSDIEKHAVTGALGYSGRRITARLLDRGVRVMTLTNSPDRPNPFGGQVEVCPFHFDDPDRLAESLQGISVLYNTYWIRFNHRLFTHDDAIRNTETLFNAAKAAGVERIVHVSITNPSLDSPFEYFRGKAQLEASLKATGVSHAILRPAVLFGGEDILINNIAWMLRHLPAIGIFGNGQYRLQPIHVDDLAMLAVKQGETQQWGEDVTVDAIGPETFTYRELVKTIARIIGVWRPIVPVPKWFGYCSASALGVLLQDKIVTWPEIGGLMADLLCTDSEPAGRIKLTDWATQHADQLGRNYHSELRRRKDRAVDYTIR